MRSNKEYLSQLKTPLSRFYLGDLHVHSVGSADVCVGDRYDHLPEDIRALLPKLNKVPNDLAAYDTDAISTVPVDLSFGHLVARRDELVQSEGLTPTDNWAVVGITDHNVAGYAAALSKHAWENRNEHRLVVLPGIELDVTFPVGDAGAASCSIHILCLFAPCTEASDIRMAIHDASGLQYTFGNPITLSSLAPFVKALRSHPSYPAMCVAAHVASSKGIQKESKKILLDNVTAEIARIEGALPDVSAIEAGELNTRLAELKAGIQAGDAVDFEVLKLIGACGFDGLQVKDEKDEQHYRRLHRFREDWGRATPLVCSDAHCPSHVFSCSGRIPFVKLNAPSTSQSPRAFFDQVKDSALRFGETRTTWQPPGRVTHWIEGIEIVPDSPEAARFWNDNRTSDTEPFVIPLSRNLNCFIGGRGSGKSAAIEAAAFACTPEEYTVGTDRNADWYKRAAATLNGCTVRICWKTTAIDGYGQLPKRALFVSRYFNPKHSHPDIEFTDLDGRAVVDVTARPPKVTVFRVHDIETAAQPDRLRELFDDLCGPEVFILQDEIRDLRVALTEQRATLVAKAFEINGLMEAESALRTYAIRKSQFDEVDKPEIRAKYQRLDEAEKASTLSDAVVEAFDEINADETLTELETATTNFFSSALASVTTESGDAVTHCEELKVLLETTESKKDAQAEIGAVLRLLRSAYVDFREKLSAVSSTASASVQSIKEAMTNEGLPTGGKDREAKKQALAESEQAIAQYRVLVNQFDELLAARKVLHDDLVLKCKERTKVRLRTAEQLTATLARDLDKNILAIVVDAQPVADLTEFRQWLQRTLEPSFARYKSNRTEALLSRGVLPSSLREFLLDPLCALKSVQVDEARAEDGRITEEDARGVRDKCCARHRIPLDWSGGELPQTVKDTLPADLAPGLWFFPVNDRSGLRLDAVLALDEVVLDDLPIIKLNDRPQDPASTLRPVHELSPGQRCSAILPILLLSGNAPVVIDQPEENLDNRLIRQVIVNILASMKLRRQVIIATHNPNLPVLGDCEQAIVLHAIGERESQIAATGDLDARDVTSYVTDIMEGGREAFQYRHSVYQTHWKGPVAEIV